MKKALRDGAIFLGITAVYIVFTVVKEIRKAAAKQS